jgi:hypothetical protein
MISVVHRFALLLMICHTLSVVTPLALATWAIVMPDAT